MSTPDAPAAAAVDRRGGAGPRRHRGAARRAARRGAGPLRPRRWSSEVGITVSIGLAANRLLAKIAAGRDKPRGFAVIGAAEAAALLAPEPVRLLPGIGPVLARKLETMGITRLGQLQVLSDRDAMRRLGEDGPSLVRRARGEDARHVDPGRETKSISAETTFDTDLSDVAGAGAAPVAAGGKAGAAAEGERSRRRRRGAETEDRRSSASAPAPRGCPARRCCRTGCSRPRTICCCARPPARRSA